MACSVILKISHGYNIKGNRDPLIEMAEMAVDNLSEVVTPGRFLVDVLPFCTFPGSLWSIAHLNGSTSAVLSRVVPQMWVP